MPASSFATVFDNLPLARTCRRIDFDFVAIDTTSPQHEPLLVVTGIKEWLNLAVELRPRCYQTRPAFWQIEVVGVLPGHAVAGDVDFHVVLPLHGLHGTEGIEILGATKSERRLFCATTRTSIAGVAT